jgi:hypothetical protein
VKKEKEISTITITVNQETKEIKLNSQDLNAYESIGYLSIVLFRMISFPSEPFDEETST